jgi:DNA gyrase subunit A
MAEKIQIQLIEEEMKQSYIDYAMSVITSRALPDVRDGLKPVHRRILYAMHKSNLANDKPFRKCAFIVGRVLGTYHPHGDLSVYDALVRMAQDFSMRIPLVDGHGNFGSIEGYPAASMRYTEARLAKISSEMLKHIDEDTVKFIPNYDGSNKEPVVLPSSIPNLLVNGSTGIAVGMATNIPPHNLREVNDAVIAMIDNPEIPISDLMQIIPGPDFPTGGMIAGTSGIKSAYETGKGKVTVLAKTEIEEVKGRKKIIITEIPYMVNKTLLIEEMADLIRGKRIEGISDLIDESDRKGMRIVIELKQGVNAEVVLNQLQKYSQLKTTFGVNIIALVDNEPRILNLREMLSYFLAHRKDVTTKRLEFELEKSRQRAHVLLGLKVALSNIDAVVQTIKRSESPEVAKMALVETFKLSKKQSEAILEMRLQRLTSLETSKINEEHDKLVKRIKELREILGSEERIFGIIKDELNEIKEKYGDERRTELKEELIILEDKDLIPEEDVVVTVTHSGYIKRLPIDTYKAQGRGGKGIKGTGTKEKDFVENLFITSTHDYILSFTNKGKLYWLKAYEIPEGGRYGTGKAIVNLLKLEEGEKITTLIPVKDFKKGYLIMITKNGLIKKTRLELFSRPRINGIRCVNLREKDELINVMETDGYQKLIIGTKNGMAVKFDEIDVRPMGRGAAGVKAVRLKEKDEIIGLDMVKDGLALLTLTENGFGKRTELEDYRLIKRGGSGVINIKTSDRNGKVVSIKTVNDEDEVFLITSNGIMMRTKIKNINKIGRNTQGVRIIRLNSGDKLNSVAKVIGGEENGSK